MVVFPFIFRLSVCPLSDGSNDEGSALFNCERSYVELDSLEIATDLTLPNTGSTSVIPSSHTTLGHVHTRRNDHVVGSCLETVVRSSCGTIHFRKELDDKDLLCCVCWEPLTGKIFQVDIRNLGVYFVYDVNGLQRC